MSIIRLFQSLSGLFIKSLSEIPVPKFLRVGLYQGLGGGIFGMNLKEAELELVSYKSFQDLFTRRLTPHLRSLQGEIVSPIDGTLRSHGKIENGFIPAIKSLSSEALSINSEEFEQGSYAVFYLSPKDYHRVHSPCAMRLTSIRHIPGMLWPVNELGMRICPKLYATNERVVFSFTGEGFNAALVMVGALNVGGIFTTVNGIAEKISTGYLKNFSKDVAAGEELGYFAFGSAVLLLISKPNMFSHSTGPIFIGNSL